MSIGLFVTDGEMMRDWPEIKAWRRSERERLLEQRKRVPRDQRRHAQKAVAGLFGEHVGGLSGAIGAYWPIKGEMDLRFLLGELVANNARIALPVVVEKRRPVEFWAWHPGMRLRRGDWGIPVPPKRDVVRPNALIVPLLGFDEAGCRLGYGGGYYDRTLAEMTPKPLCIGVGYAFGRLSTIHPQPHDVPMDAIVTEEGFTWFRRREVPGLAGVPSAPGADAGAGSGSGSYASPPCFMHELDPGHLGYLRGDDVIDFLNMLLQAERAGARGVGEMAKAAASSEFGEALRNVARDEARFCAMLTRHIERLGGAPSRETGSFYDKLLALEEMREQLTLLDRGQGWVARKLGETLPRIGDEDLHRDLKEMWEVHERNIAACARLAEEIG